MRLLAVLGTFVAILVVIGFVFATTFVSVYNDAVASETQIVAKYEDLRNVLGQYSLKIAELAQVPEMYRDDLSKVYSEAIQGRYGEGGSKAIFQFLQEQNPNLDATVYKNIQVAIEAGRNNFENRQTQFIDVKRTYETKLGYLMTGTILRIAGFPRIKLDEYKIIQSEHGKSAFETGVDKGVTLR